MDVITKLIEMFKQQEEVTPQVLLGMEGMSQRNEERISKIKEEMGTKWLHHPANKKSRLDEPRPV